MAVYQATCPSATELTILDPMADSLMLGFPHYQPMFSAMAAALTLLAFIPYIVGIRAGKTRPHAFSWLIWGVTTLAVFAAQLDAGGGVGAWPIGLSACVSIAIAVIAWRGRERWHSDVSITRADWLFLAGALSALPLWYLTADPLWAVVVLTIVDLLGFGPTMRKAWHYPFAEKLSFYALVALRNLLVLLALEQRSLATMLFPATMAVACLLLMVLLGWRRRVLGGGIRQLS